MIEARRGEGGARWAGVDIPALPLQLLLRDQPTWRDDPVVVVEEDHPLARILWLNERAEQNTLRRGMRFGEARTLVARLRAAVIPEQALQEATQALFTLLLDFSPRVEPVPQQAGRFWLDPSGLDRLFGSLQAWSRSLYRCVAERGFVASVVVASSRYRALAIARRCAGPLVINDPEEEEQILSGVRLMQLDELTAPQCAALADLGVHTIGDFLSLPEGELRQRFGVELARTHARLSGAREEPFAPQQRQLPIRLSLPVEPPDDDHGRLLFILKGGLHQVMQRLAERCEALVGLQLLLHLDHAPSRTESLQTAAPTLDVMQVVELLRLRLESIAGSRPWGAAVEQIDLEAEAVVAKPTQVGLLNGGKRNLDAAARALARIRASFGANSVTHAYLKPGVLPEARFGWSPIAEIRYPRPAADRNAPLILSVPAAVAPEGGVASSLSALEYLPLMRRMGPRPEALPGRHHHHNHHNHHNKNHGLPLQNANVRDMRGPFRLSGGWWARAVERDYYYVETDRHDILWIYYDRPRRRWYRHGVVD